MDERNTVSTPVSGTQSAARALSLLRHVGANHGSGIRLRDLIALSGLDRSTTHRLLTCLIEEGFVERIGTSKLYRLGIEALQWGFSSAGLSSVVDRFRPVMQRLARLTGDTVFLLVRSGDFAVCLCREEGEYPVKAFIVQVGVRRLLGTSAVGAAIMAMQPDEEIAQMFARNGKEYARLGIGASQLRQLITRARKLGYSESADAHVEMSGVGCAFALTRNSYAGLSIAAINSRMSAKRRAELGELLVQEVSPFAWRADGQ
jgi:DNA-binding IclR family transcriptional regulator